MLRRSIVLDRACGGIGIHDGLKIRCRKACGFESHQAHYSGVGTARSGRFFCKEDIQVGSNPSTSIMKDIKKDIMKDREKQIKKLLKRVYKKYGRALKRLAK